MKIMLSGGESLGPVTPLLALVEVWRKQNDIPDFVWVGTKRGPERELIESENIRFLGLSVPKLSRHAPLKWVFIPFRLITSIIKARKLLFEEQPNVIVSAGGHVSVPLIWAAKLLNIPTWIHQQDKRPGLANKLMAPFVTRISVTWDDSLRAFPKEKTERVGNPVRSSVFEGSKSEATRLFDLDPKLPTVLVIGGGTGSIFINQSIESILESLTKVSNVIHLTGKGKGSEDDQNHKNYYRTELLTSEMKHALAVADVIICRAGMGTITELAALKKAAIMIPLLGTHQEENAELLDVKGGVMYLKQDETSPQVLFEKISLLLESEALRYQYGERIHAALPTDGVAEYLAGQINSL